MFYLYSSEYSKISKMTVRIPSTSLFTPGWIYKLFNSFKIITRTWRSFYFNYVILDICLFFYISNSTILIVAPCLALSPSLSVMEPCWFSLSRASYSYLKPFPLISISEISKLSIFLSTFSQHLSQFEFVFSIKEFLNCWRNYISS